MSLSSSLEGKLTPVVPTIFPTQLQSVGRKFTPDELGPKDAKPPTQLSAKAVQILQQLGMQNLVQGMRLFGSGVSRPEEIFPFFSWPWSYKRGGSPLHWRRRVDCWATPSKHTQSCRYGTSASVYLPYVATTVGWSSTERRISGRRRWVRNVQRHIRNLLNQLGWGRGMGLNISLFAKGDFLSSMQRCCIGNPFPWSYFAPGM